MGAGMEKQSTEHEPLAAETLRNDARIAEAKSLLVAALREHAQKVCGVRPPRTDLTESYQSLLARLTTARGAAPVLPYLASGLGNGPWVELSDGSVKLDFIGGIGVHGLGHSDPRLLEAAIDAALEDTVMQGNLQQNPASLLMCERLLTMSRQSGAQLAHCLLTTSGAMANENAMKLAFHNRYPADRVIAFENAFAGRSLAMAAITDRAKYREKLPLTLNVDYIPFFDPADPQGSTKRTMKQLDQILHRYPNRHAVLWAELVAGEGGYYPGTHEFFQQLCERVRSVEIPIVFDEIQTFSRLSRPFAFQHFQLDEFADIVTVGKITQVCATLYGERFKPQAPILSQTFTGSSSMITCGLAMLSALDQHGCFGPDGTNQKNHQQMVQRLQALGEEFPGMISGPYGCGMMIAWTPGDGSAATAKQMIDTMYEEGLIGFICGSEPTRVRILPPPAATSEEHLDAAIDVLRKTLLRMRAEQSPKE